MSDNPVEEAALAARAANKPIYGPVRYFTAPLPITLESELDCCMMRCHGVKFTKGRRDKLLLKLDALRSSIIARTTA
jgi:hypothetical protein